MKIDKSNWSQVKLADITIKKEENDKTGAANRFDKFLKVEHLDAESLHIKRWGNVGEDELPPTFYKIFRKGQILYPTRNPHLKRVALASFDGICGEKTLTLEPIHELVDEMFYPFIFLSQPFHSHTTSSIIGSTNPHVRWRDVAEYEFLLPPKEQQAKLAELLWAADGVIQSYLNQSFHLDNIISITSEKLLWNSNYDLKPIKGIVIKEIGEFVDGDWIESKDQSNEGIRLVQLADIGIREFTNKSRRFISDETFRKLKCFEILSGDILIARMPDPLGRACIFPNIKRRAITAVDVCVIRIDCERHNPKYWEYLFNSNSWFKLVAMFGSGTTRTRISRKNLESINAPTPPKSVQNEIVAILDKISDTKQLVDQNVENSSRVLYTIINQVF